MWYVFYIEKDKSRATFELCHSIASAYTKGKQWVLKKTIESFYETEKNLKLNLDVDIKDANDCKEIFEQCEESFDFRIADFLKGQELIEKYKKI